MSGDAIGEGLAGQRLAADPKLSVWVSANAGAGKTSVLTDRVLRLLLDGTRPGAILCLTYTKAAAAEMANRIAHRLGRWVMMDEDGLRAELERLTGPGVTAAMMTAARQLFVRVLDAPGGLAIQTIHAFCGSLLQRFPLEAGIAPDFAIADDAAAEELLNEAMGRVLDSDDGGIAAARDALIAVLDEGRLTDLLQTLVRDRRKLDAVLARHGGDADAAAAAGYRALNLAPGIDEGALFGDFVAGLDAVALGRAADLLLTGSKTDQDRGTGIKRFLAAPVLAAIEDDYASLFLTGEGEVRKALATKKLVEGFPTLDPLLRTEADRLLSLLDQLRAVRLARASGLLLRLGAALTAAYEEAKRRRGLLDYDDLILRSRALLQAPGVAPWVLYKLDGGIDHLLVDEAQDTSPEQWDVIAALVAEFFAGEGARDQARSVFAVGDEKQSIYSFQGAVPARFQVMRDRFQMRARDAGRDFRAVSLPVSFRSVPAILAAVDATFADPAAARGVAGAGEVVRHLPFRTGAGRVELWPLVEPPERAAAVAFDAPVDYEPESSPRVRLAQAIAASVAADCASGAAQPGDIMILLRRRDVLFDEIVRQLKLAHIPVAAADRMSLPEQLAAMDLIALGRFLLQPDDDLTLATVLKSPLFGLSDDDLIALCPRRGRGVTVWSALRTRADETVRWRAATDRLQALLARVDFATPYVFYAELLGAGQGRRQLLARLGNEAQDAIDAFLDRALDFERSHVPTLQGFLDWLERSDTPLKRDMEQVRGMVRVMTVHGAKGLEAPIVILPDTTAVPDRTKDAALLWIGDPEPTALVWRGRNSAAECRAVADLRETLRQAQLDEYRRLFYVALTRAERQLTIAGWQGVREPGADSWYRLAEAALPDARVAMPMAVPSAGFAATGAAGAPRLPDWAGVPPLPEPEPSVPLAPSRATADEPPGLSPLVEDGRRFRRGRAIHRLLQTLPDLAPEARHGAARRYLAGAVPDLDGAALAGEVLAVLDEPAFAAVFGPGSRAEVPVVGRVGRVNISGQVDRLVVMPDRVLIVDFKTDRPPPASPDRVGRAYLRQMALYRAAIAQVFPGRGVDCALLWTDGPRLMDLPAALLDAVLAPVD